MTTILGQQRSTFNMGMTAQISLCNHISQLTGWERIHFCLGSAYNFIMSSVGIAERVGNRKVLRLVDPAYQIRSPGYFRSQSFERLRFLLIISRLMCFYQTGRSSFCFVVQGLLNESYSSAMSVSLFFQLNISIQCLLEFANYVFIPSQDK